MSYLHLHNPIRWRHRASPTMARVSISQPSSETSPGTSARVFSHQKSDRIPQKLPAKTFLRSPFPEPVSTDLDRFDGRLAPGRRVGGARRVHRDPALRDGTCHAAGPGKVQRVPNAESGRGRGTQAGRKGVLFFCCGLTDTVSELNQRASRWRGSVWRNAAMLFERPWRGSALRFGNLLLQPVISVFEYRLSENGLEVRSWLSRPRALMSRGLTNKGHHFLVAQPCLELTWRSSRVRTGLKVKH